MEAKPTDDIYDRIRQKDAKALEEFYLRHGRTLYILAYARVKDSQLAEEALQDTGGEYNHVVKNLEVHRKSYFLPLVPGLYRASLTYNNRVKIMSREILRWILKILGLEVLN